MKKSKQQSNNAIKNCKNCKDCKNNVSSKSNKNNDIGFSNESKSFELDENEEHSFELR